MARTIEVGMLSLLLLGCAGAKGPGGAPMQHTHAAGSFADDVQFLAQHTEVLVLESDDGLARVAVAPAYQGRVMTSTCAGEGGASLGYVHRKGVALGTRQPHITVLGGEDRFWLGPEGGQFGLYFAPGAPFDLEHWQVPEPIDWGAFALVAKGPRELAFRQTMNLTNHSGTRFELRVDRTVRLLSRADIERVLSSKLLPEVRVVAYETDNRITNVGSAPWRRETGLVSIWILGMYPPAPRATVVIPYVSGPENTLGKVVNDAYFGAIPKERLQVGERAIFFRGDGGMRGKIGVSRPRARDIAGSYDPDGGVLTVVQYTLPEGARDYVNSMWEVQAEPYAGDVVNSYNDGPLSATQPPLGPFYELESSSPGAALEPGQTLVHVQRTLHLQGTPQQLDGVALATLGVSLAEIVASLPK